MVDDPATMRASRVATLMKFPDENPKLHEAVQWWESTQTRLATAGLVKSATGKMPDAAERIIDTKLSEIPELPSGDRDYHRRQELRISVRKQNAKNRIDRRNIFLSERTAVFSAIFQSAEESAPMWARELREVCDYSHIGVEGGHFDGALAYKLAYAKLFEAERTQADIDFYDTAKQLQKRTSLADGCRANEFMLKAYAWIYKIRPHLAQPYSDADAAEYIVQLMPKRLGPDARRIKEEMKRAGSLSNLMQLARELEKIVYADQSAAPPAPALVMLDADLSAKYDMMALADMTGMALVAAGAKPSGSAGSAGVQLLHGVDGKWCSKCPHDPCFLDPNWQGPLPVFLFKNAEKKKALLKARADNAKGAVPPVTCQALKAYRWASQRCSWAKQFFRADDQRMITPQGRVP